MAPARVLHTIHLLPQDATWPEHEALADHLHPTRTAYTFSADVAHAVVYHGARGSKVVIWDAPRWGDDIAGWFDARGINWELRYLADLFADSPPPTPIPPVEPPKDTGKDYTGPIGLHASADPGISQAEISEFRRLRPGIIKVLSFHEPEGVRALAAIPGATRWIVRAFLSMGGRKISPHQFVNDTYGDTKRTVDIIRAHGHTDIVIELHNEPNLVAEGFGSSWDSAEGFAKWYAEVCSFYRAKMPGQKLIYPGLSPGPVIPGIRPVSDVDFYRAARSFILNGNGTADGFGVHAYWSANGIGEALSVVRRAQSIIPERPLWVTEASDKSKDLPDAKASRMAAFYRGLPSACKGVTFFVASASDPAFAKETWVDRDMARRVRERV